MDVLKACIYLLTVTVCVNLMLTMMTEIGMTTITPLNTTQWEEAFDPDKVVDSWGWGDNPFYDIATGLISFWTTVRRLVEGVPMMLEAMGTPEFIYKPIYLIYRLLWLIAITLGIIAGRQT